MIDQIEPTESGETFWMLLSLLCLPPPEQISVIGELPELNEPHGQKKDPAGRLLRTLTEYYSGWWDAFYPNCPASEKLYVILERSDKFGRTNECFLNDENWNSLRSLAKQSLAEVGLDPFPVPDLLDFREYIEIEDE